MPDAVLSASHPDFTPDGRHAVFGFTSTEEPDNQVAVMGLDGRGFRCLTCDFEQVPAPDRPLSASGPLDLGKPFVFQDGRRVLVRQPGREDAAEGNEVGDFNYYILECAPSLIACDRRELIPLELPTVGLTRGYQNREGRISYDGRFLAWTAVSAFDGARMTIGRLVREAHRYTVEDPRVLNPPFELDDRAAGWALAGPLYEFKRFSRDGRTATYAGADEASNFDTYELDLLTGARRRLSRDPDWDEDAEISQDGRWMIRASARGLDRMDVFSQLPRPPFIEFATFAQIGRYVLRENRGCLLTPWLTARRGESGTYAGQPIDLPDDPGWSSHPTYKWSPDGTRVLFWQRRTARGSGPVEPNARMAVVRFPARRPQPARVEPTPNPVWAPRFSDWNGVADDQVVGRQVRGPGGGTAVLDYSGGFGSGSFRVTYSDYSADEQSFLSGSESLTTPLATSQAEYAVDLALRGAESGSMTGRLTVGTGARTTGSIESTFNGRTLRGLPVATTCPGIPQPVLRARRVRLRRLARGRVRLTIRVNARVLEDPVSRPVRHARVVAFGRARRIYRRAGSRGLATFVLRAAQLKRRPTLRVKAAGFRPGRVRGYPRPR